MKVAFVNQPWDTITPPVNAGSIPIWTYETARRLIHGTSTPNSNCEVIIYARRSEQQAAVENHDGIEYRRISVAGTKLCNGIVKIGARLFPSFRYLNSELYGLPYALRIATDLRQQQCDIVHIHNFSQFIPIIKAFNPSIKIALHMHCEWLSQFERKGIAKRLAKADLIVGCSDYITDKIKARFPEFSNRCQRVFNGVDTEQFQPDKPPDRTTSTQLLENNPENSLENNSLAAPQLLFVGRISPEKGLHTLIETFSQLTAQFPAAKLHLVGPNKQATAEFIADLSDDPLVCNLAKFDSLNYCQYLKDQIPPRLKEQIIFTGAVSHQALHRYFQTADVLVNPSISEAFGMSLVEAMAASIPTVATQVGGMSDIVLPQETGLLVPPEQPAELASAIAHLLKDSSLRTQMGKAARARAIAVFSWEAIASNLHGCYAQLLPRETISPQETANPTAIGQPQTEGSQL